MFVYVTPAAPADALSASTPQLTPVGFHAFNVSVTHHGVILQEQLWVSGCVS